MKIREIKESELDYLWNFEKENRNFDRKTLGDKFKLFYIHEINEKEKENWLKGLKKSFQKPGTKIFVMEDKGVLVSYIWAEVQYLEYLNPKKKVGYINELFVEKKFRKRGISRRLVEKCLEWFKKQKIGFVSLSVFAQNKDAVEVYKRFGFEPFSIYMRKKI